jgi:DNA-directed RNA polymerase subunit RPC12/RpoP
MSVERQELYCHNCGKYVQFNLDLSVDGNYKLNCPNCGHEHYRIVKDGKITDERWGQDPSQGVPNVVYTTIYADSTSSASTYDTYSTYDTTGTRLFLYEAWMNTTTGA